MSLTEEFFIQRDQKLNALIQSGYTDIGSLEEQTGITIDQLIQAGYLSYRELQSTADLYKFSVTQLGQPFLKEIKSSELILVMPNCIEMLKLNINNKIKG